MTDRQKYTPEEATQLYLDLLKSTNPSKKVQDVIDEIEDELQARPTHKKKSARGAERPLAISGR